MVAGCEFEPRIPKQTERVSNKAHMSLPEVLIKPNLYTTVESEIHFNYFLSTTEFKFRRGL